MIFPELTFEAAEVAALLAGLLAADCSGALSDRLRTLLVSGPVRERRYNSGILLKVGMNPVQTNKQQECTVNTLFVCLDRVATHLKGGNNLNIRKIIAVRYYLKYETIWKLNRKYLRTWTWSL